MSQINRDNADQDESDYGYSRAIVSLHGYKQKTQLERYVKEVTAILSETISSPSDEMRTRLINEIRQRAWSLAHLSTLDDGNNPRMFDPYRTSNVMGIILLEDCLEGYLGDEVASRGEKHDAVHVEYLKYRRLLEAYHFRVPPPARFDALVNVCLGKPFLGWGGEGGLLIEAVKPDVIRLSERSRRNFSAALRDYSARVDIGTPSELAMAAQLDPDVLDAVLSGEVWEIDHLYVDKLAGALRIASLAANVTFPQHADLYNRLILILRADV